MTELEFDIPSNDTSLGKSILRFSFSKQTRKEKLFFSPSTTLFLACLVFCSECEIDVLAEWRWKPWEAINLPIKSGSTFFRVSRALSSRYGSRKNVTVAGERSLCEKLFYSRKLRQPSCILVSGLLYRKSHTLGVRGLRAACSRVLAASCRRGEFTQPLPQSYRI